MRLLVVVLMAAVVMASGCKTVGGCGHQKHVKCLKCRAEAQAKDSAEKAVKCKKCGMIKGTCKCAPAKQCEKCKGPCKCKK